MDRRTAVFGLFGLAGTSAAVRLVSGPGKEANLKVDEKNAPAQPAVHEALVARAGGVALSQVPLGGGGFVTGIDISTDGRRFVCRTDVANAYVRNLGEQAWRPLFSVKTLQTSDYDPLPAMNGKTDSQGVAGVRISPSDANVIYASYYGYIWRSIDGGRKVQRTSLPQKMMPANGGLQRLFNRTIDIHPNDPLQVIVGTHGDGVWHTLDGGEHWIPVAVPKPLMSRDGRAGVALVAFDPSFPRRVYIFVTGIGLYISDSGPGGAFRFLSGGPLLCGNMVVRADGTVFLCEYTEGGQGSVFHFSLKKGWVVARTELDARVLAIHPKKPDFLLVGNDNGYFIISEDGGITFRKTHGREWTRGGEVGWVAGLTAMYPAEVRFDPSGETLFIAQGIGVARALYSPSTDNLAMKDWSAGIEELCAVDAVVPPGGKAVFSALDLPFWRLEDEASYANDFRYPVPSGKSHDPNFVGFASFLDYAGDDTKFLVGVVVATNRSSPGFSTDGGKSWNGFDAVPNTGWGAGGSIAASTKNNIVLLPSNNGVGVFTLNGGASWSPVKLDGLNPTSGFANAYYVARQNLTADKTRPGTFALVYTVLEGDLATNSKGGLWLSKDGGSSWMQTYQGVINVRSMTTTQLLSEFQDPRQFWQCQLKYVPGCTGELVYTPHSDAGADRFFWSRDDGRNWAELHRSVRNVGSVGFGKPLNGQSRPTLFFWGEVNGVKGLYVSLDWFASAPILLTRFPSPMLAEVSQVTGDPDVFGRAYVGTRCAGWIQVDLT